jgi:hypothetical protein
MSTFGNIKTNIENTAVEIAKKPSFKKFIREFNSLVLENKDLAELYYIYDDLSSNKGLDNDLVNDYINESVEYSQILIENQITDIKRLNNWINSWNITNKNNYSDIDNAIYSKGIKNLESILESKKNIKNLLTKEPSRKDVSEKYNVPISTMVKIANESLKKEISTLSITEQKELESIVSLSYDDLVVEMKNLKNHVVDKLKSNLNESKEDELKDSIKKTIGKIMDAKCTHYDYYKLKKLSLGL